MKAEKSGETAGSTHVSPKPCLSLVIGFLTLLVGFFFSLAFSFPGAPTKVAGAPFLLREGVPTSAGVFLLVAVP